MRERTGSVTVRPLQPADRPGWERLFRGYREFYDLGPSDGVVETVWGWLLDEGNPVECLVAVSDSSGEPLGIAHHRVFPRPAVGGTGIFLDDLFVAPEARGTDAGLALLRRLEQLAREGGHSLVRWNTAPDNATARRLYDGMAEAKWVSYDLVVEV